MEYLQNIIKLDLDFDIHMNHTTLQHNLAYKLLKNKITFQLSCKLKQLSCKLPQKTRGRWCLIF